MSSDDSRALLDILENIDLAHSFVRGMTFEAFARDKRTLFAVCRCLEIISEASRRLTPDTRRGIDQPWRAILDMGNFYRHEYHNVVDQRTWHTVRDSLSPLADAVRHELRLRGIGEAETSA